MLREVCTLREWLARGPYTLVMSSGFFGFFAHAGFVSVLEQEGLLPSRICGSSAGALVGGLVAAGLPSDRLRFELARLRREDFWDIGPGFGLLRGRLFEKRLESLLPARSFEECRVPLAVSVFDIFALRTSVVREGALIPALHASCAAPLLFQPVRLGNRWCADGGILDRHGLAGVGSGERVLYHHLASRPPWRRKHGPALRWPLREGLEAVVAEGLPRLGPFRLEHGPEALKRAAEGLRQALSRIVS